MSKAHSDLHHEASQLAVCKRSKITIGQRFGRLTTLGQSFRAGIRNSTEVVVQCDCGKIKCVHAGSLLDGNTATCGCGRVRAKHGYSRVGQRHPLYKLWCGIVNRCYNSSDRTFENYGASRSPPQARRNAGNPFSQRHPRPPSALHFHGRWDRPASRHRPVAKGRWPVVYGGLKVDHGGKFC